MDIMKSNTELAHGINYRHVAVHVRVTFVRSLYVPVIMDKRVCSKWLWLFDDQYLVTPCEHGSGVLSF